MAALGMFLLGPGGVLAPNHQAEAVCGNGIVDPDEECDDANPFGGDGCAENCSLERTVFLYLDPKRSVALTQFRTFRISLPLEGRLGFRLGRRNPDGTIPLVVRREDVGFDRIAVPGLACVCVRGGHADETFGPGNVGRGLIGCGSNGLFPNEFVFRRRHNVGVIGTCNGGPRMGADCSDADDCPGGVCLDEKECGRLDGVVEGTADPPSGVCNGPDELSFQGNGPPGSAAIFDNIAFTLLFDGGTCSTGPEDPAKGNDGVPCTDDDPQQAAGRNVPAVTGIAQAAVVDADDVPGAGIAPDLFCGEQPCAARVTGKPFDCDALARGRDDALDGGILVMAFPILDNRLPGGAFADSVVTITLAGGKPGCAGDCDEDGRVSVAELIRAVAIAVGDRSPRDCPAADTNGDGSVTVDELVRAVGLALTSCNAESVR